MEQENLRSIETAPVEEEAALSLTAQEETLPPSVETVLMPQTESIPSVQNQEIIDENEPSTDLTHRLAEEFILLREEFPNLQSPQQLPDAVLDIAVEHSISLYDAYLRFHHEENKRVRREEERRRQAAGKSAGSLLQGAVDAHPEQDAFLRAFRTALK